MMTRLIVTLMVGVGTSAALTGGVFVAVWGYHGNAPAWFGACAGLIGVASTGASWAVFGPKL